MISITHQVNLQYGHLAFPPSIHLSIQCLWKKCLHLSSLIVSPLAYEMKRVSPQGPQGTLVLYPFQSGGLLYPSPVPSQALHILSSMYAAPLHFVQVQSGWESCPLQSE